MEISINELAGYYANSNMAFADIYKAVIPPGYVRLNEKTTPEVCGIIIPLRGSACFKIKSTDYILSPGMIFHASPDLSIDRKALEGEPWCYYRIHFRIPKEERFKVPFYNNHFCVSAGENLRIAEIAQRLEGSNSLSDNISMLRSKALFAELVEELILSAKLSENHEDVLLVHDALSYINDHVSEPLSIEIIAEKYGIPRRRFTYLFQKQVGMPPSQYIVKCRMNRAKDLLRSCNFTVAQVAECVGFSSAFYFSSKFKEYTGVSPSEFRDHQEI